MFNLLKYKAIIVLFLLSTNTVADTKQQVRFIVPWSVGGSVDSVARLLAARLEEMLPIKIVVENKVGANGMIGIAHLVQNRSDPYMFAVDQTNAYLNYFIQRQNITYDPFTDLAPLAHIAEQYSVLVSHPSVPIKTYKDLVILAKQNPGQLLFGHGGIGNDGYVVMKMISAKHQISFNEIAYKSGTESFKDLAGGHIAVAIANTTIARALVEQNKIKIIAKFSNRAPIIADLAGVQHSNNIVLFANRVNASVEFAQNLRTAVNDIVKSDQFKTKVEYLGNRALYMSDEELAKIIKTTVKSWEIAGLTQ